VSEEQLKAALLERAKREKARRSSEQKPAIEPEAQATIEVQREVGLGADLLQSAAGGLLRGAAGTVQLPEMGLRAIRRGGEEIYQAFGGEVEEETPIFDTYTGDAARALIGAIPLGEELMEYQPQTTGGKFVGTAAEFAGGGGAAGILGKGIAKAGAKKLGEGLVKTGLTKEAQAAAITAGLGSEAAGQAAEGTGAEGAARIAGALVAPTAAARSFNLAAKPYDKWISPKQVYNSVKTGNEAVDMTLSRAIAKPSKQTQAAFKNTAYREVDRAGETFSADDLIGLAENTRSKLLEGAAGARLDITPQGKLRGEGHIKRALDILDEYTDAPSSMMNLDNMRQRIREVYRKGDEGSKAFDPRIKEIIDDIDALLETKSIGSPLLNAARLGHIRTKKLEILEDALEEADRQVKAGSSVTSRYQAALKKIATQKRSKSYFTDAEKAAMDRILEGQLDDKILRQFGKLSPLGSINLMNVIANLGLGAAAVVGNPAALAVTAGAIISKPISDTLIKGQVRELNRFLATGASPTKFRPPIATRAYGLTPQIPQE
jgi:hypothetical protein